jgi:hypothetical protein
LGAISEKGRKSENFREREEAQEDSENGGCGKSMKNIKG